MIENKNVKLTKIIPFHSEDGWHLMLVYEYENKSGKHTVIVPKASVPFSQNSLPNMVIDRDDHSPIRMRDAYIECDSKIFLTEDTCVLARSNGITQPAYIFDIITDPAIREMSLDEVEKELGYKVKIVNRKEKEKC